MFISHYNICELLKDQNADCRVHAPDYCLTGFESIRTAIIPLSLHTLYVVEKPEDLDLFADDTTERLLDALSESVNLLICNTSPEQAAALLGERESQLNYTILPCPLDVSIKLKLREFFNEKNGMGLMAESILDMLFHETGIQPIVDKIRANGFKGIIWVPGKGWQGSYADYEKYPITGENIGYAVHDYDGWYGCEDKKLSAKDVKDATQRKIQQFHNQVPMVDTNPIVITEIDWSPKKPGTGHYNEHGDWVESNYGSWATGRSSVWGEITKGVHDYYGNISMTLSGTHCYIDFNDCIKISGNATKTYTLTGRATPAYKKAMEADGLDPYDGCGVACFKWYAEYAKVNYPSLARYQPVQEYPEDPFELSKEWFNPSIIRKGTAQHVASYSSLTIKKGGLAGWSFEDCIDLSAYKTLVVKMKRTPVKNTCLRIYDSGSLFGDCYQLDLGGEKEFTIPLSELKKQSGEQLDPSHIRFVGFTPLMNDINLYVEKVYLSNDETAITAVQADAADDEGYFDLMGRPVDNPTRGFYIRRSDRKKVFIP